MSKAHVATCIQHFTSKNNQIPNYNTIAENHQIGQTISLHPYKLSHSFLVIRLLIKKLCQYINKSLLLACTPPILGSYFNCFIVNSRADEMFS